MLCGWPNAARLLALWRAVALPLASPKMAMSLQSPSLPAPALDVLRSWLSIMLLRHLKCFAMALSAIAANGAALLNPATVSNELITVWTCW